MDTASKRGERLLASGSFYEYNYDRPDIYLHLWVYTGAKGIFMVSSPIDRRSQDYGFESLDAMMVFFAKWIPETEIDQLVKETENQFRPRKDSSHEETHLQKIQKAEFAIVRRLVQDNPSSLSL